jgi:hypothetical protein
MAETHTLTVQGTAFASNKSLLSLFNGAGSGRVLRVYRVWALNHQTAGVTGVMTALELRRITASSGGTAQTAIKHDTNSATLAAQITAATGPTDTVDALFRRVLWSADEPAVGSGTNDELECLPANGLIWDAGYADTNVEPIVLREGQGVSLRQPGANAIGVIDVMIEFTNSAT